MDEKKRDKVLDLIKAINSDTDEDEDDDGVDGVKAISATASQIITLICDQSAKLLKELNGDVQLTLGVITAWMGSTQPGEAENSPT